VSTSTRSHLRSLLPALALCTVLLSQLALARESTSAEVPEAGPAGVPPGPADKSAPGAPKAKRPVPELDRIILKSGRKLEGLIVREDMKGLSLRMNLGAGFVSLTWEWDEITAVDRASPAGRALTKKAWAKTEAELRKQARADAGKAKPAPGKTPAPRTPPAKADARSILLAEARRLGLEVAPGTGVGELQKLVAKEQQRRHQQSQQLSDQAMAAFDEAEARRPQLTYRHGSGAGQKLVYREPVLFDMLSGYKKSYALLRKAAELDPTREQEIAEHLEKIRKAAGQLAVIYRQADLVERERGNRRTNPNRRRQ